MVLFGFLCFLVVADLNNKETGAVFFCEHGTESRQPIADGSQLKEGSTMLVVITLK